MTIQRKNKIAGGVIILAFLIGLTPYLVENTLVETNLQSFNASANVTEYTNQSEAGILTERSLEFGRMTQGTGVAKFFNFTAEEPILVEVSSKGNISDKLDYPRATHFRGQDRIEIHFLSDEPGYYEGQVQLEISTSGSPVGQRWMEAKAFVKESIRTLTSIV